MTFTPVPSMDLLRNIVHSNYMKTLMTIQIRLPVWLIIGNLSPTLPMMSISSGWSSTPSVLFL
jgi:hypothetical protein